MSEPGALRCEHFARPASDVAPDLIGRILCVRSDGMERCGLIVETEAYGGVDDPASHAAFRPGGRAAIMLGVPGLIYVYAAYGMYPCLNIVTNAEGDPGAVLIRGIQPAGASKSINGPGRTARWLGVTLNDQGQSIRGPRITFSTARQNLTVARTPRIGITRGVETEWRFVARFE